MGLKQVKATTIDAAQYTNWYWAEVSAAFEKYFKQANGYPIPSMFAYAILQKSPSDIELIQDDPVHYRRKIGLNRTPKTKVLFGFKGQATADRVMNAVENYQEFRVNVNTDLDNIAEDETPDIKDDDYESAALAIHNVFEFYEEWGLDQMLPSLDKLITRATDVINKTLATNKKLTFDRIQGLKSSLNLVKVMRKYMPVIHINRVIPRP